jgi:uncharacterized YccA/Bax inhibitor family protein
MANPVLTRTFDTEHPQWLDEDVLHRQSAGVMTLEGTINKALSLFGILAVTAAVTWFTNAVVLLFPAMIAAVALGFWAALSRKTRPGVMMAYAALEGVVLAGISILFDSAYPGIAFQAVAATLGTSAIIFVAYTQRWIRVTSRMRQFVMFGLLGYLAFSFINMFFAWGGNSFYSSQYGWLIGLVGVGLACFTLLTDFADIDEGVAARAPQDYEWRAAFGLMVTLIWMYTEILRLLAILRGRD